MSSSRRVIYKFAREHMDWTRSSDDREAAPILCISDCVSKRTAELAWELDEPNREPDRERPYCECPESER
jgi:hypothetical protein